MVTAHSRLVRARTSRIKSLLPETTAKRSLDVSTARDMRALQTLLFFTCTVGLSLGLFRGSKPPSRSLFGKNVGYIKLAVCTWT
jgi:hypothetical protein